MTQPHENYGFIRNCYLREHHRSNARWARVLERVAAEKGITDHPALTAAREVLASEAGATQ